MTDRLRKFIARNVFHALEGMTFGDWWALLRRNRFDVDLRHWPRALIQSAVALSNSINARVERGRYGGRVEAARVQAPLFILGHYRSGTTHLQNLLALDPQFATPTFFQVLNPHTFLGTEGLVARFADTLVIRRRLQDNVALGVGVPSEDEVAMCTLTGLSPYMSWYFPRSHSDYDCYLTLRGVPDDELARWKAALTRFFKKLTIKYDRPLLLKSPPHTARIRLLLELFPDARFIHIYRNPYVVFQSTGHLIRAVQPYMRLQEHPPREDEQILAVYTEMFDAFFEEKGLIPERRICEVCYEELERGPVGVVQSIYESLGLSGFDALRPRLETYLGSIADYRKNQHLDLSEALRERIAHEWRRSFETWGYDR